MRNRLATDDLEAFSAVARHLSFKAAAESLNISPSALSRRIQRLEERLDVRLLERTTRAVRLTLPGLRFQAQSQQILAEVEELAIAVKRRGAVPAPTLTVAIVPSIAYQLLPLVLPDFLKRHPSTRVCVRDLTTNEIVQAVERGEADFGLTSFVQPKPGLTFTPLRRGGFVLATHVSHPLARERRVRWSDVASEKLIATWKGSGVRIVLDFELAKATRRLEPHYEVQQVYTALHLVERGLGVAPVPDHFLGPRRKGRIAAIPLVDPVVGIDLGAVVSENHPLRHGAKDLYGLMADALSTFPGAAL